MVQQDKLSVDKDKIGNTHDRESEMDHSKPEAASSSDQGPFSSDPFAANYRVIPDLNDPKFGATLKEFAFALTPKQVRFSQSVEWAERLRPFKQFDVILKERDLHERYLHLRVEQSATNEERFERLQSLFREEAPDLMGRFVRVWKLHTEPQPLLSILDADRESKL